MQAKLKKNYQSPMTIDLCNDIAIINSYAAEIFPYDGLFNVPYNC